MNSRVSVIIVATAALLLSGCAGAPEPTATPDVEAPVVEESPTPEATPDATVPQDVNPNDYLLDGAIVEGEVWGAKFGFFTDETKSVRCDISASSEAPGRVTCEIMVGFEDQVEWGVPSPIGSPCTSAAGDRDGYQLGAGLFQSIGVDVGFWGCRDVQSDHPDWVAATKVMPDAGTITVDDEYTCTVIASLATCGKVGTPAFVFGLSEATLLG